MQGTAFTGPEMTRKMRMKVREVEEKRNGINIITSLSEKVRERERAELVRSSLTNC